MKAIQRTLPRALGLAALTLMGGATASSASVLLFDLGTLGANGGSVCSSNCVIAKNGEDTFSFGGLTVGAIGFGANGAVSYVTQKPGAFASNGGETGLGESDTSPSSSDYDYEITTSTWLLLDNSLAQAAGYKTSSISVESIQSGEGAKVYSYSGALTALDATKLTLLSTLTSSSGVTQTVSVPDTKYLVVQAYEPAGGSGGSDVVVSELGFTKGVPEPATWALMIVGFGFSGAALRSRRRAVLV